MVKLTFSRTAPFVRLTDVGLRRQVDKLRRDNEELRSRLVAAQNEKASALKQVEVLRADKERLRLKTVSMKRTADDQRKAHETLEQKITELREENEMLNHKKGWKPR